MKKLTRYNKLFRSLLLLHFVFIIPVTMIGSCSGDSTGISSKYDLSTAHSTIETIFETIRTNDSTAFLSLIATREDLLSYALASDSLKSKQYQRMNQQQLNDYVETLTNNQREWRNLYLQRFTGMYEDGVAEGIKEWEETAFVRATYERNHDPLKHTNPVVEFSYHSFSGTVKMGTVLIKSSRGWVIAAPGLSTHVSMNSR